MPVEWTGRRANPGDQILLLNKARKLKVPPQKVSWHQTWSGRIPTYRIVVCQMKVTPSGGKDEVWISGAGLSPQLTGNASRVEREYIGVL